MYSKDLIRIREKCWFRHHPRRVKNIQNGLTTGKFSEDCRDSKRVTEKVCVSLPLATHYYSEDNDDSKKSLMTFQDIFTTDLTISLLLRTLKGSSVGQWRIKKLKEKFKPS